MSNIIGFITKLQGSASISLEDGTVRYLAMGDPIHEGETIKTIGTDSSIQVTFNDSRTLDMGGDETTLVDESVYDGEPFADADVLAAQEALLSGEEFEFEDTAAGGEGADGSGASDPYVAERTGGEGDYEPTGAPNFAGVAPFGTDDDTGGSPAEPAEPVEPDFGVLEDGEIFYGQLESNDPGLVYSLAEGSEAPEGLTLNPDGSYEFDPSIEAYQHLAVGETLELPFTWVTTDSTGQTTDPDLLTISITGTNDQPVVSDDSAAGLETMDTTGASRTADAISSFDGTLPQVQDVDATDTHTYHLVGGTTDVNSEAIDPDLITDLEVVISEAGEYTVTGNFNALAAGETATIEFQYVADDNRGFSNTGNLNENSVSEPATITLIVTGTNDQPVSAVEQSQTEALDGNNTFTGDLNDDTDDQDVNDTHTFNLVTDSVDVESDAPVKDFQFEFNPDGTYAVTGDFNLLAVGEEAVITFQYTADDNKGFDGLDGQNENSVSEPATVTLTVTGTNDQPVVTDIDRYVPSFVREYTKTEENFEITRDPNFDITFMDKHPSKVSTITIGDTGTIKDLDVRVNLEHTNNHDIVIILEAPDGTRLHLSRWNGGSSDNYTNTYFNDEADTSIYNRDLTQSPIGPFTGSFRPQGYDSTFEMDREHYANYTVGDLAAFDGKDIQGEWTLIVHDYRVGNDGELLDWSLNITTAVDTVLYESDTDQFTVFDGALATAQDEEVNDTHTYEIVNNSIKVTSDNLDPGLIKNLSVEILDSDAGTYEVKGDFNALAAGELAFVTFEYTADDGTTDANGEPSVSEPATVTLVIEGTTDAPVITIDAAAGDSAEGTIKELYGGKGTLLKTQGTLSFEDLDFNDTHSVSFFRVYPSDEDPNESNLGGTFKCSIATDSTGAQTGELVWTYTIGNTILGQLDPDETYTQTYEIKISDGISGIATKEIVITLDPTTGFLEYSGDDTFDIAGNPAWNANIDVGEGDDTLNVGSDIANQANVNMGDGNDTLDVGRDIAYQAKVDMGAGNDTLNVGRNIRQTASVDMGEGDDTLDVGGNIWGNPSVDMGAGNDTLNVDHKITSTAKVNMGEGDDTLNVGVDIAGNATVNMGDGNDTLEVDGKIMDNAAVDMGAGDDTLILTDNSIDLGSISDNVDNVETIELGDSSTAQSIYNITAKDVFDMTDSDNILTLEGGSADSVDLDDNWVNKGEDTYTSTYNDGGTVYEVTIIIDGIDTIV